MENISVIIGESIDQASTNLTRGTNSSKGFGIYIAMDAIRYAVIVCYLSTFVFGAIGNGLVIYVIGKFTSERVKSVANYYIWSLAFADMAFVASLPLFCWATIIQRWPITGILGNITCKVSYVCRDITKFASAWTLVALSVDRCLASAYNTAHLRTVRSGKFVIATIWICCVLITLHYFSFAFTHRARCQLIIGEYGYLWTVAQITFGYLLPSVIIYTCYTILWYRMRKRAIVRHSSNSSTFQASRCMTRTVLVVVVTFTLCQTPYHVLQVIQLLPKTHETDIEFYAYTRNIVYANAASQILVFAASCCNPIIYGLMNQNFRRLYVKSFCLCCGNNVKKSGKYSLRRTRGDMMLRELGASDPLNNTLPDECHHESLETQTTCPQRSKTTTN